MKKIILMVIVFLLCLSTVLAGVTTVEHECKDSRCKEGTDVTFKVGIYNNINKTVRVNDILLKEGLGNGINGPIVGDEIYSYEVGGVDLEPGEEQVFEFTKEIIPPKQGYTHYYVACFKTSIWKDGERTAGGEVCDMVIKDFTVLPSSKVECETDTECAPDEYCDINFFKCKSKSGEETEPVVEPAINTEKYSNLKFYLLTIGAVLFVIIVAYWLILKD